jgi:hypothetical protein
MATLIVQRVTQRYNIYLYSLALQIRQRQPHARLQFKPKSRIAKWWSPDLYTPASPAQKLPKLNNAMDGAATAPASTIRLRAMLPWMMQPRLLPLQ